MVVDQRARLEKEILRSHDSDATTFQYKPFV